MKKHEPLRATGSDYLISLSKLSKQKIKDVTGYLSTEFDDVCFKITEIQFEDGTEVRVEGEHDFPYIASDIPNTTPELMGEIYEEEKL